MVHRFTLEDTQEDMIPNNKCTENAIKIPEFESEADENASSEEKDATRFFQVISQQKIIER